MKNNRNLTCVRQDSEFSRLLGPSLVRERIKQVLCKTRDQYQDGEAEGQVGTSQGETHLCLCGPHGRQYEVET